MERELVLIIEDNRDMRIFLRNGVLEPAGYRVKTAKNGREGLEKALTLAPNLILLDLNLPLVSGLDVLGTLYQRTRQIPAIVITAYGSEQIILKAFRLGAKDFLQKPFTIEEAQTAIENALREERLRREKENLTQALALANRRLQLQVRNWVALHDIAQAITSTREESEIFQRVMENVNRILHVEAGSLLVLDQKTDKLELTVTLSEENVHVSNLCIEPGQGIAGWVAKHGELLLIPDARQDPRFCEDVDQITGRPSRSILCVPLKAQDRVIGALEVINKRSGPESPSFTEGDLKLLTMLASWVAVAVENARLNRATQKLAATRALGQAVTTVSHHVNNRLMAFSLTLDRLEREPSLNQQAMTEMMTSARNCIREVSAIIRALDRLEEIQTVPYVGDTEMLDIEGILEPSQLAAPGQGRAATGSSARDRDRRPPGRRP